MKAKIKQFILRALNRYGQPMTDTSIRDAVRAAVVPQPPHAEIDVALNELSSDGFLSGRLDELDNQVTYTLTTKGRHKAAELG